MKTTNEKFINAAIKKHGNRYDYSKVEYVHNRAPIEIICPIHGKFSMEPRNHLRSNSGCNKCKLNLRLTNNEFIKKGKETHGGKYDYSKVEYKNKNSKLIIICPIHGEFEQIARNHIMDGNGCQKCANEKVSESQSLGLDMFIKKSKNIHGDKYDYSLVDYKTNTDRVKIICNIHGEFEQRPVEHLRGCNCPKCKESKGEKIIREYLIENKIAYIIQHKFPDCRNKNELPFDFYLPKYNICIEYNGAQHYKPVKYWGGEETLKNIKFRDNIKKEYCRDNNIPLIVIRYNEDIIKKLNRLFHPKSKRAISEVSI